MRRRYARSDKAAAVAEAERTSLTAASETLGLPITTLKYWYDSPEFADVRTKTRDQLAEGSILLAQLAQGELVRRVRDGTISDQALVAAFGVAVDKAQLLSGMATARMESRDLTGSLSDADLDAAIREAETLARGEAPAVEAGAEEPGEG